MKAKPIVKAPVKVAAPKVVTNGSGAKKVKTSAPAPKPEVSMEFIGTFPLRRSQDEKKNELKKQSMGPVFPVGSYKIASRETPLARATAEEFKGTYLAKHTADDVSWQSIQTIVDRDPQLLGSAPNGATHYFTKELFDALLTKKVDLTIHNLKDVPLELPPGLVLAASLKREDPRDALITRSTYGAIQELPTGARLGITAKRRIMQAKALRPDLVILPLWGNLQDRINTLEKGEVDAIIVAWASLRRLNISPRYYVALQPEMVLPSPCQGITGIVCRADDADLLAKLRYMEDSEASWASRCERAFLQKLGGHWDAPVAAFAHRKGTQDPWILDAVIGDSRSGEVLHHREIGTSRCKPESLADKAFTGILSKGARKFLPFGS